MQIDKGLLKKSIHASADSSLSQFAERIGLHRNTIYHYLSGGSPYQKGFLKLCESLSFEPDDLIVKESKGSVEVLNQKIAELVDHLHQNFPELSFVLFGSRSKKRAKPFSDWDIGFFSQNKITHQTHLDLLKSTDDFLESSLEEVDLVNLNEANFYFLKNISDTLVFLTGKRKDWLHFQNKLRNL